MLTQFVLLVFAMFAVLALLIDVGYARMTQAQMQHAADAAALEGLRQRDIGVVNPATGQAVNDPFASDCLRRTAANRVVRWTFDDDLDPANGDPDYQFGAGPIIDVTDGVTNLHALAAISVPDAHTYKPNLQLNQINQVHGDMVSGRFCYTSDPAPSEGAGYIESIVCTEPQRGSGNYARNDFNPNATSPLPPAGLGDCPSPDGPVPEPWPLGGTGSLAGVDDSAFLVRLRRSNELQGFADQAEPDVASSGPSLPLVFGRGSTIHGDDPSGSYSVRRDGLTVRATAISETRPALQVGLPQPGASAQGVTPFTLADTFVQSLTAPAQLTLNPVNGLLCRGLNCNGVTPATAAGRFVDALVDPERSRWRAISIVGQVVPPSVAVACVAARPLSGYGPVYSAMASGTNRIIGFTRILLNQDPARAANPCAVVATRGASLVAASNATAVLTGGLPLPPDAPPAEIAELLDKNAGRNGALAYAPVLAPVLVR